MKSEAMRVEELKSLRERDWADVDERNRKLRAGFRVGRKEREKEEKVKGALLDKMSLGIELVPEVEEDGVRAKVEFLRAADGGTRSDTAARPVFITNVDSAKVGRPTVASTLHHALSSNTRSISNPFAVDKSNAPTIFRSNLPGVKRRKVELTGGASASEVQDTASTTTLALVDYDSD